MRSNPYTNLEKFAKLLTKKFKINSLCYFKKHKNKCSVVENRDKKSKFNQILNHLIWSAKSQRKTKTSAKMGWRCQNRCLLCRPFRRIRRVKSRRCLIRFRLFQSCKEKLSRSARHMPNFKANFSGLKTALFCLKAKQKIIEAKKLPRSMTAVTMKKRELRSRNRRIVITPALPKVKPN